jgi:hypothetical protein
MVKLHIYRPIPRFLHCASLLLLILLPLKASAVYLNVAGSIKHCYLIILMGRDIEEKASKQGYINLDYSSEELELPPGLRELARRSFLGWGLFLA